ncbi:MAG: hypothetical protein ABI779_17300 [Acidobacteriota bacterium]
MNVWLLLFALAGDPASCPMHAEHMKQAEQAKAAEHTAHAAHSDADARGDVAMGFSHERTKHTFRLLADGGAIEVRANEAGDGDSIAAIRTHLREIARQFTAGDFARPLQVHDRLPDGVPAMKALGAGILYQYEELENGARVRITTRTPAGLEAVHQFLRFQIEEHHTGDPQTVE